jgi:hypothetical protein
MKKITLLPLIFMGFIGFCQKTTGVITLNSNTSASISLDESNSLVTLMMTGPNDRWFALQFGSFDGGMESGTDVVYWNGSILVDARHNGIGSAPTPDPINNWTQVSNLNNTPSNGLRTIVYTRPFDTGDENDYVFEFENSTIDLAYAVMNSATFLLQYHGSGTNRGVILNVPMSDLSVKDFTLNSSEIYPNPSNGHFTIMTKTNLEKVTIYSHTGDKIRSIDVRDNSESVELSIMGLQTGIYLIELQNSSDKSWKKIIIN